MASQNRTWAATAINVHVNQHRRRHEKEKEVTMKISARTLQHCRSEKCLARPNFAALSIIRARICVKGGRERWRRKAVCRSHAGPPHRYTQREWLPRAFHVASEQHMAGTSQGAGEVAQRIREEVKRLSGRLMSGQNCKQGIHSRTLTGFVQRGVRVACSQCRYLEFMET